jgi:protein ImuA
MRLALDGGRVDAALGGGLMLAGCHEIYGPGSTALALMLALASPRAGPILWLAAPRSDEGRIFGAGLAELGGDPGRLWLVNAGGALPMLRAAAEAQRCAALACVVIEAGSAAAVDLTVTRRLQLAAAASGVFTLLLRAGPPRPSAALTRWRVAHAPARRLAAGAPGPPRLALTLERQRGGPADIAQELEWDRDRHCFLLAAATVARPVPIGAAFGQRQAHPRHLPAVAARAAPRPASAAA